MTWPEPDAVAAALALAVPDALLLAGAPLELLSPLSVVRVIYALAVVYSLYFVLFQENYSVIWMYGILFVFFYLAIMLWQTYYAIATCRTATWGTRPATAGLGGGGGQA